MIKKNWNEFYMGRETKNNKYNKNERNEKNDNKDNYYIYGLFDINKKVKLCYDDIGICFLYEPFYIGKGEKRRQFTHFEPHRLKEKNFKNNRILKIIKKGFFPCSQIIIKGMLEKDSLILENKYIISLGRKNNKTGILTNLTDGGEKNSNSIHKTLWKKVDKIDPITLEILQTYNSLTEAASMNNIKHITCISRCCNKKAKIAKGYIWRYHNDDFIEDNYRLNKGYIKINIYDLNKNYLQTVNSMLEASKIYKDPPHIIYKLLKGKSSPTKYLYEYYDTERKIKYNVLNIDYKLPTKKVCVVKNNNEIIEIYKSSKECADVYNVKPKLVAEHCIKKQYTDLTIYNFYYYDDFLNGYRKTYKKKGHNEHIIYSKNIKTTEIISYTSIKNATEYGFNKKTIRKYLNTGLIYRDCLWYYTKK